MAKVCHANRRPRRSSCPADGGLSGWQPPCARHTSACPGMRDLPRQVLTSAHRLLAHADGIWVTREATPERTFPSSLVDVDANIERPKVRGVAACTPEPCLILHPTCDAGTDQPSSDRSLRLCWRQCIIAPADRSRTCNFARWRKGFRMFFGIFSIVCACMGKSRDDSERGRCSP